MSRTTVRVPPIQSEITVAIAYLGWSVRQLADYAALVGQPIGEAFLEDALLEPWPTFRAKADPARVDRLIWVLGGLGIGLQDGVFGVVPYLHTRLPSPSNTASIAAVIMGLTANYPKAPLRLAVQAPSAGDSNITAALLLYTGDRYFLCDNPAMDPGELANLLYANCLDRLLVSERRICSVSSLSVEAAVRTLLDIDFRPALQVSRGRVTELLLGRDCT